MIIGLNKVEPACALSCRSAQTPKAIMAVPDAIIMAGSRHMG